MAFHVACPITWLVLIELSLCPSSLACLLGFLRCLLFSVGHCLAFRPVCLFSLLGSKRICFCELGFPRKLVSEKGRGEFLEGIARLEDFLKDPWLSRVRERNTVQVPVPKVATPPTPSTVAGDVAEGAADELSVQTKRAVLQKKAAAASLVAEDFARRFESGDLVDAPRELAGDEQGQSNNVNVMCRLCFSGENEGSERARRMLSCRSCRKKYHRSCLKVWAQHRDLFHWSSWTCPSCRVCEVCRRTGDPNKFKFCKRCDGAYHCYCLQPPHKNVSYGPYLCPKHTRCHSCGSNVPGNGLSLRWFLGYTCCDACGRLFTKGNYCPVCLKVYRDSESTPMVCCDICQRWVHCQCDGISDEKYLQFQVDGNLPYTCPTCRGECYQVRDLEDAIHELWRRKDEADRDLIASLRAAAGLPTEEEIFSISPFSDDEDNDIFGVKNEYGRVKFSFKGLTDSSPKMSKEQGKKAAKKKSAKKKGYHVPLDRKPEFNPNLRGHEDVKSGTDMFSSPVAVSLSPAEGICSINQQGVLKHKFLDEVARNDENKRTSILEIKSKKMGDAGASEDMAKDANKSKPVKGTKLVIHLGGRNRAMANSSLSDSSSYHREQESTTFNAGSEAVSRHRTGDKYMADGLDSTANLDDGYKDDDMEHKERGRNLTKLGKGRSEVSDLNSKSNRGNGGSGGYGLLCPRNTDIRSEKGSNEGKTASLSRHPENRPALKLKFKNPFQGSWAPNGEDEKGSFKGQRSKRKRSSLFAEKLKFHEEEEVRESEEDKLMDEIMDANWILRKLGKDAVGKRVEVHQPSDDSWHQGVVTNVAEGKSLLSVNLDNGRYKTLELGKQGIRFVPQKQKRQQS